MSQLLNRCRSVTKHPQNLLGKRFKGTTVPTDDPTTSVMVTSVWVRQIQPKDKHETHQNVGSRNVRTRIDRQPRNGKRKELLRKS